MQGVHHGAHRFTTSGLPRNAESGLAAPPCSGVTRVSEMLDDPEVLEEPAQPAPSTITMQAIHANRAGVVSIGLWEKTDIGPCHHGGWMPAVSRAEVLVMQGRRSICRCDDYRTDLVLKGSPYGKLRAASCLPSGPVSEP